MLPEGARCESLETRRGEMSAQRVPWLRLPCGSALEPALVQAALLSFQQVFRVAIPELLARARGPEPLRAKTPTTATTSHRQDVLHPKDRYDWTRNRTRRTQSIPKTPVNKFTELWCHVCYVRRQRHSTPVPRNPGRLRHEKDTCATQTRALRTVASPGRKRRKAETQAWTASPSSGADELTSTEFPRHVPRARTAACGRLSRRESGTHPASPRGDGC